MHSAVSLHPLKKRYASASKPIIRPQENLMQQPARVLKTTTGLRSVLGPSNEPWQVNLQDPAVSVMTDFRLRPMFKLEPDDTIDSALEKMKVAGLRIAFVMDNRLRNLGRSNLGLSSKLMGDAMCFARGVLEAYPWGASSLTEDAEYRAHLLQHNIRVFFAPDARAYGEMVNSLSAARHQRARPRFHHFNHSKPLNPLPHSRAISCLREPSHLPIMRNL